jgi:hypothetical protein
MKLVFNYLFYIELRKLYFLNLLYFSLILFVFIFKFNLDGCQKIKENIDCMIDAMQEDERLSLEKLFQRMFNHDHFSYTLFYDKPISLSGDFTITPFQIDQSIPCGGCFWKNWEIWKKYQKDFPMIRYLLIEGSLDKNRKAIYFINKKAFIKTVNKHLDLFRKELGENITAIILLNKIEENHKFLSFLHNNQMLLGILLGYGEHNAELFSKRHHIRLFVNIDKFPKVPFKVPSPSKNFDSLLDEFNAYFSVLRPFGDYGYSPLIIKSVHFVADPNHPTTLFLQKKYKEERGKISAIYAKGNFLKITLSQLIDD